MSTDSESESQSGAPAGASAHDIMDKEVSDAGADSRLGKQISKPVTKILERLFVGSRGSITLVGVDGGAPLALSLLEAHGKQECLKSIERVVSWCGCGEST